MVGAGVVIGQESPIVMRDGDDMDGRKYLSNTPPCDMIVHIARRLFLWLRMILMKLTR